MPPPQRNHLKPESPLPSHHPPHQLPPPTPQLRTACDSSSSTLSTTTKCLRRLHISVAPLSCSLFLVLFVFVSCVVPLSTPSSTGVSTPIPTLIGNASFSNDTTSSSGEPPGGEVEDSRNLCPTAKKWIETKGSFCFTLGQSTFLKNVSELRVREARAIDMFCELDRILEKVDCRQPYSVNVDREQCWLCREAYRDWTCAMTTDTLADGRVDCEGGVMPCPSCASICHHVMRLCPYLTPDRVQFDEMGDPTAHVSQYGGHPAFYCPLENIHASDPAYTSDCTKNHMYAHKDPDYVHNLCAADARFVSKRSAAVDGSRQIIQYSSCCWTYASSLVQNSGLLEKSIKEHGTGYYRNRVILNCCDGRDCQESDPDGNNSSLLFTSTSSSVDTVVRSFVGSTLRTANNQVRGEDGKFRELSNAYLHDESIDDEDDDEEYYEDSSSSAGEMYSSGGSSNERRRYLDESTSVFSLHRDNKIYSTRESRSVHETFYMDETNSASSSAACSSAAVVMGAIGCLVSLIIPPLVLICSYHLGPSISSYVIINVVICVVGCYSDRRSGGAVCLFVLAFRIVGYCLCGSDTYRFASSSTHHDTPQVPMTTNHIASLDNKRSSDRKLLLCISILLPAGIFSSRQRCSCCEYLRFSNYGNNDHMNNLPIHLRLSHRKLVVNYVILLRRRDYYHVVKGGVVMVT